MSNNKWDGTLTYSFPSSPSQYAPGYSQNDLAGLRQVGNDQKLAVHFALNTFQFNQWNGADAFAVEAFTNLRIRTSEPGRNADIQLANSNGPSTAYAYFPNNSPNGSGGDAFFGQAGRNPVPGNYDWHTVIHELGHSLGLEHGHDNDTFGNLPRNVDSMEFSVMTYRSYIGQRVSAYVNDEYSFAQTFMMLDIAALQHMYGADFSSNAGDTTYKWRPGSGNTFIDGQLAIKAGGKKVFLTIWDGGGRDTYDLTAYKNGVDVDLEPGGHTVLSRGQLADLGGGPNGGLARGSVFNALQYNNDPRSLIENVSSGSGNDTISGNDADNRFASFGGNDRQFGGSGDDTMAGGTGRDTLNGQTGDDVMRGDKGSDTLNGGHGGDTLNGGGGDDRLVGQSGNDRVVGGGGGDRILGQAGRDNINGSGGDDYMDGGADADRMNGAAGNDTMLGGTGADTMIGGTGNDRMWGGSGQETFVFKKNFGRDIIEDYNNDILDLTGFSLTKEQIRNKADFDDGFLKINFGGGDQLWLRDTRKSDLDDADILV